MASTDLVLGPIFSMYFGTTYCAGFERSVVLCGLSSRGIQMAWYWDLYIVVLETSDEVTLFEKVLLSCLCDRGIMSA